MDYKPHTYASKSLSYDTRQKQQDPRIKLYEPSRPIKDIPPTKVYDTRPPSRITARTYDKVRTYDSYEEYVPPWSRGKEKGKKGVTRQKPVKATSTSTGPKKTKVVPEPKPKAEPEKRPSPPPPEEPKVKFAPLPAVVEKEPSLQALGSMKRMMDLFYV